MAFLLFAARKVQLKREINSKNYELQLISLKRQEAQKAVADKQQYMNDMKNMTSVFAQGIQGAMVLGQVGQLTGASVEKSQQVSQDVQAATTLGNQAATAITSISNSIFDAMNKQDLARLQAQAQSLDLRQSSLQSQLSSLEAEYKSVESAEKEAAQSTAPKFGLA